MAVAISLATVAAANISEEGAKSIQNVMGRECQSLNGRWAFITDIQDLGVKKRWFVTTPANEPSKQLKEVSYMGGERLNVPGDWNSQNPEYVYYEAPAWYQRRFHYTKSGDERQFLHFGAVANHAMVYLNGKLLGEHSGGWTPFQFEVTDRLKSGENEVVVRVDNIRTTNTIPALSFDWWNYGGITRDVNIVTTPATYIEDYWLRLEKGSMERLLVDVRLNGAEAANKVVTVSLKGTKISKKIKTDKDGFGTVAFDAKLELWSPESPKLYDVVVESESDKVEDKIGFRSFEVRGAKLFLNGKPIFLRGINIHEEIASERRRSYNAADAEYLLDRAEELGCNFIRLSHYAHNEYMVRALDARGFLAWEEIPVWQGINFASEQVCDNAREMMREMICRDKNRCAIAMWSIMNETFNSNEARNKFLIGFIDEVHALDNTRAVTAAINAVFNTPEAPNKLIMKDPVGERLDIIGVNKYMGWYQPWLAEPTQTDWITVEDKPLIISEFGGGGLYGSNGDQNNLSGFSEERQEKIYKDDIASFERIPNLCGTAPWILFDFRSPRRPNLTYQQGWNRKGLLSPFGDRKLAWFVMKDFYTKKEKEYK